MGRSIYFTDLEIEKLIDYVSNSVELLGEAEDTWERTAEDMENGLGSAIRKLYKGRKDEKREKQEIKFPKFLFFNFQKKRRCKYE